MKRLGRIGVLVASILGLLGVAMPAAEAVQVGTVAFQGNATLSRGLGYPCVTPVTLTPTIPDLPNCVPDTTTTTKPKPKTPTVTNVNVTVLDGNFADFTFVSTVCVGAKMTGPAKSKPAGVDGSGPCIIFASGTLGGYCGMSSGVGRGSLTTTTLGVPKPITFTFKFWTVGRTMVVDGIYSGMGKTGQLKGIAEAMPNEAVTGTSCFTKTGTQFVIAGSALLIQDNTPL